MLKDNNIVRINKNKVVLLVGFLPSTVCCFFIIKKNIAM
ncbi:hypothetical protein SMSP1_00939 [Sedimentisphaera salicampi]|nr:hypothetical protein SMSP1_00939 [Sedimentisphaera salicampi]